MSIFCCFDRIPSCHACGCDIRDVRKTKGLITLIAISALCVVIGGVGLAALGTLHDWWHVASLAHLTQVQATVMLVIGLSALICLPAGIFGLRRHCLGMKAQRKKAD